jgi:hypothetical protein
MTTPASYLTRCDSVEAYLSTISRGQVLQIGRSAGDRALHAVCYGSFEAIERQANLSSALSAQQPEAFFGSGRDKQVLMITSAVHGAEMESIAAVMHLISVLESGCDLDGIQWPALAASAAGLRIVIVPIGNPDGRARIDADDPLDWSEQQMEKYRHGLDADGEPNGWMPGCFTPHPRPPGHDAFLGGYFNDAGVNPSHGVFLDRALAPETHMLADLAEAETADCLLDLHSCSAGPFFISGYRYIPDEMTSRQSYFDGAWRSRMRQAGLPAPVWTTRTGRSVLGLEEFIYHRTGALPLLFEGGSGSRYTTDNTHRQIVETYMLLFETVCQIGATEGFKR